MLAASSDGSAKGEGEGGSARVLGGLPYCSCGNNTGGEVMCFCLIINLMIFLTYHENEYIYIYLVKLKDI
jgi:hypothetical protein